MGLVLRYLVIGFFVYLGFLKLRKIVQKNYAVENSDHPLSDPYIVLGVSKGATHEEIKSAYKKQLAKYHPDKVDHLGDDLKMLAIKKTKEISWAYEQLSN